MRDIVTWVNWHPVRGGFGRYSGRMMLGVIDYLIAPNRKGNYFPLPTLYRVVLD